MNEKRRKPAIKKRHDFFDGTDVEDGYNYQRKKSLFRSRITITKIKKVTNIKMNLIIKLDNVNLGSKGLVNVDKFELFIPNAKKEKLNVF